MPLVYACIMPHGSELIEKLATRSGGKKFNATRVGMIKVSEEARRARPDTIVIASPHNLRLWKHIAVVFANYSSGRLQASPRNKNSVSLKVKCDTQLARELTDEAAKSRLPVVGANYASAEGSASDMPMDWGTLIPLWFLTKNARPKPKMVIVTPSREIPLQTNFQFGRAIARVAERKNSRIAFVASADQAHAYKKSGPYGYSKMAPVYDKCVLEALKSNSLRRLLKVDKNVIDRAKPDSLWQMAILAGVVDQIPMISEVFSHQVPTYFGMICAGFRRTPQAQNLRRRVC